MKHKLLISGLMTLSFAGGVASGYFLGKKLLLAVMKERLPLIANTVGDVLVKYADGDMTEKELKEYMKEQLEFITIAIHNE